MYLFYDNQGNLLSVDNQDIVVKGSSNANFIFVNVNSLDYAQYSAIATFKLPNASADTVQLVVSNTIKTIDYAGKQYQGYVIFLDDAITYYQGDVDFTLSLTKLGTSTTLNLEQFTFHVDESTISGEPWDAYINQAQYENIMNYINSRKVNGVNNLGTIQPDDNGRINATSFYNLVSEALRSTYGESYFLLSVKNENAITNAVVSSSVVSSGEQYLHVVNAIYWNNVVSAYENIGYIETFNSEVILPTLISPTSYQTFTNYIQEKLSDKLNYVDLTNTSFASLENAVLNIYQNYDNFKTAFIVKIEEDIFYILGDKELNKYVILSSDGYYRKAVISNGGATIIDNYIDEINQILATITDTRIGITSQYVSQPSNVKVGSTIYIDAKLRDSVNLFDVNVSGDWGMTAGGHMTTFDKLESGVQFTLIKDKAANDGVWINTPRLALDDLGLNVGDTIVFSANTSVSDSNSKAVIIIRFYDESGASLNANVTEISPKGGGYISISPTIIPSGTKSIDLVFSTNYSDNTPANTIYTFTNIQLQKGNVAIAYEPYGAYSKGKVMQYASKNILNLTGTKQTANTTSLIGKANVPYTIPNATTSQLLPQNDGSFGTTIANAKRINVKKNHKYFVLLGGNFQGSIPDAFGIFDSDFVFMNSAQVQLLDNGHTYCGIITPKQDANNAFVTNMYWYGTNRYFTQGDEVLDMLVIDLTANGYHNLTVEEAYDKYSSSLGTLSNGGSVANNVYQSPLIKVYSKELYLTKSLPYRLDLYEFKENPPYLNEDVSLDDLTLIKATTYTSSSQIELDPQTNSIIYFVYATNYRPISQEELAAWQTTDQLEYGTSATEHSDYIAPIEIGTFDKSVDGNEKTFSFVVLGTENQNIGFMPQANFISIDFAKSVSDLTSSTFAYQSTNLATTVAELTQRVETLESQVASILEMLNNN